MSNENTNVERYKFDPIKGFPSLNWFGKRPFRSTTYFPSQLKESYGAKFEDGWFNKIFWGDNLQVMSHLLKEFRGKVDLIYIDPPFDSGADYRKKIKLRSKQLENDQNFFEEKQYSDIWVKDGYLQYMYERLILLRELMSEEGSIYVHIDSSRGHYIKCIMDEVFGGDNFKNEIIREKCNPKNYTKNCYGNVHDNILFYVKNPSKQIWNKPFIKRSEEKILEDFPQIEKDTGRRYKTRPVHAPGKRNGLTGGEWKGMLPPDGKHWQYKPETLDKFDEDGRIEWSSTGNPRLKVYADESEGVFVQSIWTGMKDNPKTGYPTEKNIDMIKRIIESSSNENSIILDCFCGSGRTLVAAQELNRKYIGVDINLGGINTSKISLLNSRKFKNLNFYLVNNYDIFRNPLEAKELLLEALEITQISKSIYDGEKDGRMIKVMPVDRIATRSDINELISAFDYKIFQKRKETYPNKPVEKLTLICMGHEPDLKAGLELAVKEAGFQIDVEVVDILRENSNLEFKRDSEVKISVKNGKVVIDKFYPMNLLQKLSLNKSKVDNWKELTESIMIDWNYDGAVLSPSIIDIPEKNSLVVGEYEIPKEAGTIKVKITDLLSESIEVEVQNG